ncbi:uncharacterized protein LOC144748412 [Ciona intestinalis]
MLHIFVEDMNHLMVHKETLQQVCLVLMLVVTGYSIPVSASVETYDSTNNTWKVGNNMVEGRASCAAVHFYGKIFVFGGFGSNNTLLTSGEFMNIADGVWTMLTNNIPFQLGEASACCVGHHVAMYGR